MDEHSGRSFACAFDECFEPVLAKGDLCGKHVGVPPPSKPELERHVCAKEACKNIARRSGFFCRLHLVKDCACMGDGCVAEHEGRRCMQGVGGDYGSCECDSTICKYCCGMCRFSGW